MLKQMISAGAAALLLGAAGCVAPEKTKTPAPDWKGKSAGSAYLGEDVLWRPRENLLFHMKDELGSGFSLRFTVRDMNTYVHAPAPILFQVVGPDDRILVSARLEDDGITGGNFAHQDGIYDPFADFRYRQYHRANTPGGMPPGKSRSPYLRNPEKLPFRVVDLEVPAGGKGLLPGAGHRALGSFRLHDGGPADPDGSSSRNGTACSSSERIWKKAGSMSRKMRRIW